MFGIRTVLGRAPRLAPRGHPVPGTRYATLGRSSIFRGNSNTGLDQMPLDLCSRRYWRADNSNLLPSDSTSPIAQTAVSNVYGTTALPTFQNTFIPPGAGFFAGLMPRGRVVTSLQSPPTLPYHRLQHIVPNKAVAPPAHLRGDSRCFPILIPEGESMLGV